MYINTHCNYSQPTLIKLYNENIGGHLTPLHYPYFWPCPTEVNLWGISPGEYFRALNFTIRGTDGGDVCLCCSGEVSVQRSCWSRCLDFRWFWRSTVRARPTRPRGSCTSSSSCSLSDHRYIAYGDNNNDRLIRNTFLRCSTPYIAYVETFVDWCKLTRSTASFTGKQTASLA